MTLDIPEVKQQLFLSTWLYTQTQVCSKLNDKLHIAIFLSIHLQGDRIMSQKAARPFTLKKWWFNIFSQ